MRVAVVGHVEWVEFARVDDRAASGRDRSRARDLGGAGRRRRRRGRPAGRLAGACALFTALGSRRARAALARRADAARSRGQGDSGRRSRRGARSRTSTTPASGRSPCSARSCVRGAVTAGCRGASSRAWTPSTSSAATPRRSGTRATARVLVASARELATLRRQGSSWTHSSGAGRTRASCTVPATSTRRRTLVVTTAGGLGGWVQPGGPFRPRAAAGPGRGHVRLRRLLRRRPDVRAGSRGSGRGRRRARGPLRGGAS